MAISLIFLPCRVNNLRLSGFIDKLVTDRVTNRPDLARMFEAHWGSVYRECCRILRNPALAEDAAAETYLRACRSLADFDNINPLGWLLTIARNVCLNLIRKASSMRELNVENPPERVSNEDSLDVILLLQSLPEMISSLQDDRRVALRLYLHGYSYQQMASYMGCEERQIRTHLQTSFRQLRKLWESGQRPVGGRTDE